MGTPRQNMMRTVSNFIWLGKFPERLYRPHKRYMYRLLLTSLGKMSRNQSGNLKIKFSKQQN